MAWFDSLSVFFPMWNEEPYVRLAVAAASEACQALVSHGEIGDYEIIVVNDASTDTTGEIAEELARADPHVRVVHHAVNRKLGGSLKTGFAEARSELVLYTDADLPFDLMEVEKACRFLRIYEADVVSAYRYDRTSEGPRRALLSFVYNWLVRFWFGIYLRDVNFSFKLCRRRIFEHVRLESEGSFIDVELLVRASRLGYKILQFGVDYFPRSRGVSTLSSSGTIVTIVRELVRLHRSLKRIQRLPAIPRS